MGLLGLSSARNRNRLLAASHADLVAVQADDDSILAAHRGSQYDAVASVAFVFDSAHNG